MKFDELLEAGRRMEKQEITANILSLAGDPRFAALLGLLDARRRVFQSTVSSPTLADKPGALAHVAGGLNEALNVMDTIKGIIEPAKARGPQPPEQ